MPGSVVQTVMSSLVVDQVTDISMSTIELDGDGQHVRVFQFYGTPESEGSNAPLVLSLRLKAATKAALEITTPILQL